jgi:hypothetical protein
MNCWDSKHFAIGCNPLPVIVGLLIQTYLLPAHPRKDREKHGIKEGEKTSYFLHMG